MRSHVMDGALSSASTHCTSINFRVCTAEWGSFSSSVRAGRESSLCSRPILVSCGICLCEHPWLTCNLNLRSCFVGVRHSDPMDYPRVARCESSIWLCMRSSINLSESLGGSHGCWTMSRWYNNKPSIFDLECVQRLVTLLWTLEAAVESLGVNSRLELLLFKFSKTFHTAYCL